mmetsp:Transcript_27143/g.48375  ORF Transcript_27143/g.48375 Transcript_27143/m.48375 type:complete len:173 (-) Transcript_27143:437-955(-)
MATAELRQRLASRSIVSRPPATVEDEDSSPFECNICLELSREPVVTFCGHLFCWPCLYRWLQVDGRCRTCPVCKSPVDKDKVVPIYGRGGQAQVDSNPDAVQVPRRPSSKPPQASLLSTFFGGSSTSSQPSFMNSIFILEEELNSPEYQHQAILARLLLMLGSFVIMFLLLI